MQPSGEWWYYRASKIVTIKALESQVNKGLRCLSRDYLSYTRVVGIVVVESTVSVPLRRVFRYAWMDISCSTEEKI